MTDGQHDIGDAPEPTRDPEPDRAPGGADANAFAEGDVGATEPNSEVLTPDQPLSAQQDVDDVPDAIQEPEGQEPGGETDNTEGSAPSG